MSKFKIGTRKLEGELRRGILEIEKVINNEVWITYGELGEEEAEGSAALRTYERRLTALADLRMFGFTPEDYYLVIAEGCRALDIIMELIKGQLIDATGIRLIDRAITIRQMLRKIDNIMGGIC